MPELSITEAQSIIARTDPRSDSFWSGGNKELESAVRGAFERSFPGEFTSGTEPQQLRNNAPPTQPNDNKQAGTQAEVGAEGPIAAETRAILASPNEWGAAYEPNMTAILNYVNEHSSVERLDEIAGELGFLDSPQAQAEGLKLLLSRATKR
jgi:hypothetical protein